MTNANGRAPEIESRAAGLQTSSLLATVICVSSLAAIATAAIELLSLELWAMFMGWTCFGTGGGNLKRGAWATCCLLIGLLLAMGAVQIMGSVGPMLGAFALPVAVFVLAAIALASHLIPPLDSVPGYFLGMTTYFASGLAPGTETFVHLGGAALIGAAGGFLSFVGLGLLVKRTAGRRKA